MPSISNARFINLWCKNYPSRIAINQVFSYALSEYSDLLIVRRNKVTVLADTYRDWLTNIEMCKVTRLTKR
jgi:hypothetical protein